MQPMYAPVESGKETDCIKTPNTGSEQQTVESESTRNIEEMTVDEYLTRLGEIYIRSLCVKIEQRLPLLDKLFEKESRKMLDALKTPQARQESTGKNKN
jgi:hypothetical protein